jgi:sulfur carrier protein ThiS
MLCKEPVVTMTAFGRGRYRSAWSGPGLTVADVLGEHGVEPNGRRVAVNGHGADGATTLLAGDELTVVPRVQGG